MCCDVFFAFPQYKESFEKLKKIFYKDVYLNGICIRILGIHFMQYGVNWSVKTHSHSFFEAHYCLQNSTLTTTNGIENKVDQEHFYIMPPGTFHSHRQNEGTDHIGVAFRWELINPTKIDWDCGSTPNEFNKVHEALINVASNPVFDKDSVIFNDLLCMLKMADDEISVLEIQIAFVQMLIHFTNCFKNKNKDMLNEINYTFLENHLVSNTIKFIEENYSQEIDVHDISGSVHLSYSHLSRIFKKCTGETIAYHLNSFRLKKAQNLLLCSDKTINVIARDVGFNSEFYFCNIFKKFYGISPGFFRKTKGSISD